jgi:hypothetical protein
MSVQFARHDCSQRQVAVGGGDESRVGSKVGGNSGTHGIPVPSQAFQPGAQPLTMSGVELVIL